MKEREKLLNNIRAIKALSEVVRTSFGPPGADKLIIDRDQDILLTKNGSMILRWLNLMEITPPIVKMVIEAAISQEEEFKDGTLSVVILVGELLSKAEELIKQGFHPMTIISGYKKALRAALDFLNENSFVISPYDRDILKGIIMTAMASRFYEEEIHHLSNLILEASFRLIDQRYGYNELDIDRVKIIKISGDLPRDSYIFDGIVLEKKGIDPNMPKRIENVRIALLNKPLEFTNQAKMIESNIKYRINTPEEMKLLIEQKKEIFESYVRKLKEMNVNVLVSSERIDDLALHLFSKNGIMAIRWARKLDLELLSYATGAKISPNIESITSEDIGFVEFIEEKKIGEDKYVFIKCPQNSKSITLIIRGTGRFSLDETERMIIKGFSLIKNILKNNRVVVGGGATEVRISLLLNEYAVSISGKDQVIIQKFGEALEAIPMQLAKNAGMDPIETILMLKALHYNSKKYLGINVFNAEIDDMFRLKIFEPSILKENILKTALEATLMILKIDDVIFTKKHLKEKKREDEEIIKEAYEKARKIELTLKNELRRDYEKVAISDTRTWLPSRR